LSTSLSLARTEPVTVRRWTTELASLVATGASLTLVTAPVAALVLLSAVPWPSV
jgi:hypothetical protein